ncbi:hypothetical protein GCM10023165_12110 [Variovorax defluvii]|uniref:Uncharacterized protein n=1 Tax=Variovorax defluvii TaxID=913761 RepID=A0ABP8H850_9BURK
MRELLEQVNGLKFGDYGTISPVTLLGEDALDPVAEAIDILVNHSQWKTACTLISMVKPELRLLVLERCPDHAEALKRCPDAEARKTLNRALDTAGHKALRGQDFSGFLRLLPFCSRETASSLQAWLPPLTLEMVQALDEKTLIQAVDITVDRIKKLADPEAYLAELESLLTIAGKLQGPDLPRAVVMKCIVWESLGMGGIPDPVVLGKLKQLQYKTLLPALTPTLLARLPDEFKAAASIVAEEQATMSQNFKEGPDRLPLTPFYEFFGFRDALEAEDLSQAARLIHDSRDAAFRKQASEELFAVVTQKLIEGLTQQIERKDAEAAKQEASMEHEMAAVLAMTGVPSLAGMIETLLSQAKSPPGHFAQVLLEKLGFPAGDDPLSQTIEALPTLCDDHPFALDFILRTDQGKALVAQAVTNSLLKQRYHPATVASLVMALAERIDLQSIFLEGIAQDASAMMTVVIDLLKSGAPRGAEAAEKILSLTEGSKAARESLRAQMRDLLNTLCDEDHVIELDFILKTTRGERLVAQAVEDYLLLEPELNAATVFSLFKALAHRVDLRTTELFTIDAEWYLKDLRRSTPTVKTMLERLEYAQLGPDEELVKKCTQDLDQWRAGWRLLLLPCLHLDLSSQFGVGILSVFSAKAFDAAAADGKEGGARERMNHPLLGWRKPIESLKVMLNTRVAGQPLLSDEALVNVMRAILSHKVLASTTLEWMESLGGGFNQKRLYKAMASALNSLQADFSPSRFDHHLRADHAVAGAATLMEKTIDPVVMNSFKDEAWWQDFLLLRRQWNAARPRGPSPS